jgi:hypothetical protein
VSWWRSTDLGDAGGVHPMDPNETDDAPNNRSREPPTTWPDGVMPQMCRVQIAGLVGI